MYVHVVFFTLMTAETAHIFSNTYYSALKEHCPNLKPPRLLNSRLKKRTKYS